MARRRILLSSVTVLVLALAGLAAWLLRGPSRLPRSAAPRVVLTDVTAEAGIDFQHESGARGRFLNPETFGPGAGWLDYNGDGLPDLLLVNGNVLEGPPEPRPACALYRNKGGGRFEDVTAAAELVEPLYGMGFVSADIEGDGDQDIFLYGLHRSVLYLNDGTGRFRDTTERAGLSSVTGWVGAATFLDYDRDGNLDLFVGNYVLWSPEAEEKVDCTFGTPRKKYCPVSAFPPSAPQLFHGRGDGGFEERTAAAGLAALRGKALGVVIEDYDRDGAPDLFVANDSVPNFLLHNRGDGTFEDRGVESGFALDPRGVAMAGMGIDSSWLPDEGPLLVAVGNFSGEPTTLHFQDGRDYFVERSMALGVGRASLDRLTFGLRLLDLDLDGRLDLLTVNGHVFDAEEITGVPYRQRPQLFMGTENGGFEELRSEDPGHFLNRRLLGRALAAADYDGDGDLDLVVTENQGRAVLLRNDLPAPRRYVRVDLRGAGKLPDALGAEVTLHVEGPAGAHSARRTRQAVSSYLSQSERQLTFGLGRLEGRLSAEVLWPSGRREVFAPIPEGKESLLIEGRGSPASPPRPQAPEAAKRGLHPVEARRRGIESAHAGKTEEAVRILEDVVRRDPDDLAAQRTLLAGLDRLDRVPELEARIAEIVRRCPEPQLLLSAFAILLREEGCPRPAARFFEEVLRIDPARLDARMALGNLAFDRGDWDAALAQYRRVLEARPDHLEALTNAGKVYAVKKERRLAADLLRKALELRPGHAAALSTLGGLLIEEGDLSRAQETLEEALRNATSRETRLSAYGNLGILHLRKREPALARRCFESVLELDPGDRQARAALERLSR
jgi:tetratricopeptide (TPR) repeat protein